MKKFKIIEDWEELECAFDTKDANSRALFCLIKSLAKELGYELVKPEKDGFYYSELQVRPNDVVKYMRTKKDK